MDIFSYEFMQRAFLAGLIAAIICPLVGIFMVLRKQSLLGDGLGHIAFAGVTGASFFQIAPPIGAVVLTVSASMGIEWIRRRQSQYTDMILALFFYAGLAMAVIFSSMSKIPGTGLMSFLFGSILTVTDQDILNIAVAAAIAMTVLLYYFPRLLITSFDEEIAAVAGVKVNQVNMAFAVLVALVVVIGMAVVGILLISALMIIPVATAHLLGKGFKQTLLASVVYSVLSVVGGLILSFQADIAPGGTIVMLAIAFYVITFLAQSVEKS